jgi:prevent-host-death family protein
MTKTTTISATQARQNFFKLVEKTYLKNQTYIVTKNNIPMAKIVAVQPNQTQVAKGYALEQKVQRHVDLIHQLQDKFKTQPITADSLPLIQEIRSHAE